MKINKITIGKDSKKYWRPKVWHAVAVIILILIFYFFKIANNYPIQQDLKHPAGYFGVTFSKKFCSEIGLDWKEVYLATINDLQVKEIRLPIYWDEIETEEGIFDFTDYDYIITEGAKKDVKFIANIGWRLPRWPECHAPEWASKKNLSITQAKTIKMLEVLIEHYKDNSSIVAWQLENEPFFNAFGVCPPSDDWFFSKELEAVKKLDDRPVIISATGELSLWLKEAKLSDIFGSTVYRVVWGPLTGYIRYPIPAWFYRLKAYLAGISAGQRVIIELQAEPWVPYGSIIYLSPEDANRSFSLEQFKANLQYAINIRFDKVYVWGVEWWYWQYKNGDKSYWELARNIF